MLIVPRWFERCCFGWQAFVQLDGEHHLVYQCCLPMVYVGNNGDISNVLHILFTLIIIDAKVKVLIENVE